MSAPEPTTVLTLRVPADLDRRISREARRARKTKSALLRDALIQAFADGPPPDDPRARGPPPVPPRQPPGSEREAIDFVEHAADTRGWR